MLYNRPTCGGTLLYLQDSLFLDTLLSFVNRFSLLLTGGHGIISNVSMTAVTSLDNVTVVDVYVISPVTNGENNYQSIDGKYAYCMNAFHFLEQGEQMERTEKEENLNDRN